MVQIAADRSLVDADKDKIGKVEDVQLYRDPEEAEFHQMLDWDGRGVESVGIPLGMPDRQSVKAPAGGKEAAAVAAVG